MNCQLTQPFGSDNMYLRDNLARQTFLEARNRRAIFLGNYMQNGQTIKEKLSSKATPENLLEVIDLLTDSQVSFLMKLWYAVPERTSFAEGRAEGGIINSLHQKGLISPVGRDGTKIRWQLSPFINYEHCIILKKRLGWRVM